MQITKTINDLVEACSSDERDDYPEVRKEAIKIFELLPHLFSQILSAKCESKYNFKLVGSGDIWPVCTGLRKAVAKFRESITDSIPVKFE